MTKISLLTADNRMPPAPLAGFWHPVLFSPEPATGERITIGIALRRETGGPLFRWLKSFDRLRRVFGGESDKHLPFLIRHAASLVTTGATPDTPHLHFGEVRELWSRDVDRSMDELFLRFVPLARDFSPASVGRPAIQNRRLRDSVYQHLKTSLNSDAASLIPQNADLRSADNPPRYLSVPIQGRKRFGTLVSAQAKQAATIDRNIFPAVAQLHAASKIHGVRNMAIFLLRPEEGTMPEAEYEEIDEHIHQAVFILENEGYAVFPEVSTQLVAEAVQQWGLN